MNTPSTRPTTVDAYIAQFPPEIQEILEKIRAVIQEAAPGAAEKISYQMPGYSLHGSLVWFGAWKHHIGLYPTGSGLQAFLPELEGYPSSKGGVQFPFSQPIPYDLIRRIVQFKVAENLQKKAG